MYSEEEFIRAMMREQAVPVAEGGGGESFGLVGYPLASVYAPLQEFQNLYDEQQALKRGTLFSELDKPFSGGQGVVNGKL